jgi:hypothetical protein
MQAAANDAGNTDKNAATIADAAAIVKGAAGIATLL